MKKSVRSGREGHRKLCVVGNAVQDVTIRLDIRRLRDDREANKRLNDVFTFLGTVPLLAKGSKIIATRGSLPAIAFDIFLEERRDASQRSLEVEHDGCRYYDLSVTDKLSLRPRSSHDPSTDHSGLSISVPIDSITWAGGGVNVVKTIRALSPGAEIPIRYIDVGGLLDPESDAIRSLKGLLSRLAAVARRQGIGRKEVLPLVGRLLGGKGDNAEEAASGLTDYLVRIAYGLMDRSPDREDFYRQIVGTFANYASEAHLELFLKEHQANFGFYRLREWLRTRNLVIAGISGRGRPVENKIILRGIRKWELGELDSEPAYQALREELRGASVVMLNSVYDERFFAATLRAVDDLALAQQAVLVIAMTQHIQQKLPLHSPEQMHSLCHRSVLLFNEREFADCLGKEDQDVQTFLTDHKEGESLRVEMTLRLLQRLVVEKLGGMGPEVYVTLGSYGSIGVSGNGQVYFMGTHSPTARPVRDTTGCGDAYAGAVTMMTYVCEHSKEYWHTSFVDSVGGHNVTEEKLFLTMGLATQVAYSKATSARGAIEGVDVIDLLRNERLPWVHLGAIHARGVDLNEQVVDNQHDGRLRTPLSARLVRYEGVLPRVIQP